jgi:hypothetical protein
MPIERKPHNPLPRDYRPPLGNSYHVQDKDTWKTLAFRWFINVEELIYFNFHTINSDEVNWYLHWNVGCKMTTRDGFNWMFSSSAYPGIIYYPPSKSIVYHDGIDEFNERMGSGTDLAKALEGAERSHRWTEALHFSLDIAEIAHIAIAVGEIGEIGLASVGFIGEIVGPFIGLALSGMALGAGDMEAVDEIKTKNATKGICQGVVLGAAREKPSFIRDRFVEPSRDYNVEYPEQRKVFQKAYLWGLVHGLEYVKPLTRRERFLLFKHLDSLAPSLAPPGAFYMDRRNRDDVSRYDYYIKCAAKFQIESTSE